MPQTATSRAKPQANSEETNLLYSGEFFDKDLNQQYLRARYYNQNNGQFNRLDPYSGNLSDPQSLHKYAYCHQDPVNHIDPSGNFSLAEITVVTTIIGTLSGLSLGAYYGGFWGALQGAITGFLLGLFIGEMIGLILATGIYFLDAYCGMALVGDTAMIDVYMTFGSGTTLYAGALEGTTTQIIANKFKNMFSRFTSIFPRSRVRVTVNNTTESSNNSARSGVNENISATGNSGAPKSVGTRGVRVMTEGEVQAVIKTGKLRGGNPGETYFTKDLYKSASKVQQRLALPTKPTHRLEFRIKNNPRMIRNGTKVKPDFKQPGKGSEFMTIDPVEVEILNIQRLNK